MNLKRCACGQTPTDIIVIEEGKWCFAYPTCCGEWHIEFRADHTYGKELKRRAYEAWNEMPRADNGGEG